VFVSGDADLVQGLGDAEGFGAGERDGTYWAWVMAWVRSSKGAPLVEPPRMRTLGPSRAARAAMAILLRPTGSKVELDSTGEVAEANCGVGLP
jgi:hypothetical protein